MEERKVERLDYQYMNKAHPDYIKFNFEDLGPSYTTWINQVVTQVWEAKQFIHSTREMSKPKFTFLGPAKDRPMGAYIVELFGFSAQIVYDLPIEWLARVTFFHVKAFTTMYREAEVVKFGQDCMAGYARRGVTVHQRGNNYRGVKGLSRTVRVGSKLSDFHYVVYRRPAAHAGMECRYRGKRLDDIKFSALDHFAERSVDSQIVWQYFVADLARDGINLAFKDMARRGITAEQFTGGFMSYLEEERAAQQAPMATEMIDNPLPVYYDDFEEELPPM